MIDKKKFIFFALILTLIPLVYASNYGEGVYGGGNYNVGEVIVTPIPESPSGGGSSGGGCSYNWQCTEWFPSICPESGIQERICVNEEIAQEQKDCQIKLKLANILDLQNLYLIFT